jgi:hypothetical protein
VRAGSAAGSKAARSGSNRSAGASRHSISYMQRRWCRLSSPAL